MDTSERQAMDNTDRLLSMAKSLVDKGGAALRRFREEILIDLDERLKVVSDKIGEDGVDPFGMDPEFLRRTAVAASFLYKIYFRCSTVGIDNVPDGPVIIVANHAGQLPIDGLMITTALIMEGERPRLARSMVDRWVPTVPFISTFYARNGVTLGTPENALLLLKRGEALLTFPEGLAGITKTVDKAYQLQKFGLGFMRLALSTGAPIIPVAVLGSEEQYPTLYNLESLGKIVGLPAVPIWAQMIVPVFGLLPLPVKYHLEFGEPMYFASDGDEEDATVSLLVEDVRVAINEMLESQRGQRRSLFW